MGKPNDTRGAVEAELAFDPLVDAADIDVKSLARGEIALTGAVPSYPQYREAADAAQRVAGVTLVHDHGGRPADKQLPRRRDTDDSGE